MLSSDYPSILVIYGIFFHISNGFGLVRCWDLWHNEAMCTAELTYSAEVNVIEEKESRMFVAYWVPEYLCIGCIRFAAARCKYEFI